MTIDELVAGLKPTEIAPQNPWGAGASTIIPANWNGLNPNQFSSLLKEATTMANQGYPAALISQALSNKYGLTSNSSSPFIKSNEDKTGAIRDILGSNGLNLDTSKADAAFAEWQRQHQSGFFSDIGSIAKDLTRQFGPMAAMAAVAMGQPQIAAAINAGSAVASGASLEDIIKSGATSYVAGQFGGNIGSTLASETGSQLAGNVLGGAATGGIRSAISGTDIGTGLLSGSLGSAINQGFNSAVDTGYNLLSGANAANNAPVTDLSTQSTIDSSRNVVPTTGTNNMDFTDVFANTISYPAEAAFTPGSTGDASAYDWNTINNYYDPTAISAALAAGAGQSGTDIANQIGSGVYGTMAGEGVTSWTPEDTMAAANAGVNQNTLTSMLKQFGSSAVKSLLGIGGAGAGAGTGAGLLTTGANYLLSQKQLGDMRDAYAKNLAMSQAATNQAVNLAKFSPVGVTTAFGKSNYTVDPVTGQITQAGYTSTPEIQAAQRGLMSAGQAMIPTGSLQDQAKTYLAQQQGLLAPGREQQLAQLQNRLYQTGTSGLATGGTVSGYGAGQPGLRQANPLSSAYYNAMAQQDAQLAAAAQQQALTQAQGQTALAGSLFGQAGNLETLAQSPLTLGSNLANLQATAGGRAGQLGLLGGQGTAATQLQGALTNAVGQSTALGQVVNPLAQGAQNILGNMVGSWFK